MSDPDKDGNQEVLKPEATTLETPNVSLSSRIKMICANCRRGPHKQGKVLPRGTIKKKITYFYLKFLRIQYIVVIFPCCIIDFLNLLLLSNRYFVFFDQHPPNPPIPVSGNHHAILCFLELDFLRFHT